MKITKRQLKRIIREEKAKLLKEVTSDSGSYALPDHKNNLEFAMDEYGRMRTGDDPNLTDDVIRQEIIAILDQWLDGVALGSGEFDTDRWS